MESVGRRRVLVVANRTAATPDLLAAVKRYAREAPSAFTLLIPDAPRGAHADWTLELALPLLERAAGDRVEGMTGTEGDPFDAVRQALAERPYDRVIISTLPRRVSAWLRRDLPRRVAALGVPVEVVTAPGRERVRDVLSEAERAGLPPAGLGGI
jgi:membrane-associated protease RseP (regulator of RpoE activity)